MRDASGTSFQSPLAEIFTTYIAEKQALGYHYTYEVHALRSLDRFLAEHGLASPELPREILTQWLAKRPHERPRTHAGRACLTRRIARYMAHRGVPAWVPPPLRTEITRVDFAPRIFTRAEIRTLLSCVDRLPATPHSPRRHVVMPELFRILYGCGLRVSEALRLTVADVDLDAGVLLIREGKFRKDRLVPVSPGIAHRLRRYAAALERERDLDHAFFPKHDGSHYDKRAVYAVFRGLLRDAGISHGGRGHGPRLHDLRHTFAVHRLEDWYRRGDDLSAKLLVLSAYMGHQSLAGTQRYLQLTPALFPDVVARLEAFLGPTIPGRQLP